MRRRKIADTSDLKKRLEALEGEGKAKTGKRPPLLPLAILGGIVALGALWIIFHKTPKPEQLPTGIPEEFQTVGSGFGRIDPQETVPEPLPPIAPSEPDAGNVELQAQFEAMRAEIEALRNTPPPAPIVDDAQLTALREEMARLREEAVDSQSALQEQLEERAREIQRLQTDLELARLEAPRAATPSGTTAEELRLQELERRDRPNRKSCKPVLPARSSPLADLVGAMMHQPQSNVALMAVPILSAMVQPRLKSRRRS